MKFITYHTLFHILIVIFENNIYHVIMSFTRKRVHKMFSWVVNFEYGVY